LKDSPSMEQTLSRLDLTLLERLLSGTIFCNNIVYQEITGSTNQVAKRLAEAGAVHGSLVISEEQRAGRGRMGRKWLSAPYRNLLFSVLLRPRLYTKDSFLLTVSMAVSIFDAVLGITGREARIKWPNDIYMEGRKAGGILTELSAQGRMVSWAVVGVGLNVNWTPGGEFASISEIVGRSVNREPLLGEILKRYDYYLEAIGTQKRGEILERYESNSLLKGKEVLIQQGQGAEQGLIKGKALGIDSEGALLVEDNSGQIHRVSFGDVSVVGWENNEEART